MSLHPIFPPAPTNAIYHWSGTWRHKKKNGELIYVEVSSHEIIYDGKKGELVLCYDITDQVPARPKTSGA